MTQLTQHAPAPLRLRLQDRPAQPWRNGGGVTRPLLCWPEDAQDDGWQFRLSVATVDRSGPFSAFPGATRWFAVLEGAGVLLQFPEGPRPCLPGQPACCFDGALAPGCELLAGPTLDLNLMLRQCAGGLWPVVAGQDWRPEAALAPQRQPDLATWPSPQAGAYAVVAGRLLADGQAHPVQAHSLVWWAQAPRSLRFEPEPESAIRQAPGWWLATSPTCLVGPAP